MEAKSTDHDPLVLQFIEFLGSYVGQLQLFLIRDSTGDATSNSTGLCSPWRIMDVKENIPKTSSLALSVYNPKRFSYLEVQDAANQFGRSTPPL
jgi:hypothetical protein